MAWDWIAFGLGTLAGAALALFFLIITALESDKSEPWEV